MKSTVLNLGLVSTILFGAASAIAQTSAQGRAFGTTLDLGGTNVITSSDTGVGQAPPGNAFDKSKTQQQVPAAPVLDVITGPSRTRGCVVPSSPECTNATFTGGADPLSASLPGKFFVHSKAGNATAAVLVGQSAPPGVPGADVLDVVSSGSTADVVCDPTTKKLTVTGNSVVDALVIGGTPVPVPGPVNPNTTIVAAQLPILVLNEQFCPDPAAPAGTARCIVNAAHAQLVTMSQLLDLKVSGSAASLTNCPCCVSGCKPVVDGTKTSVILQQDRQTPKNPQNPEPGDPIRFTITAVNNAVVDPSCPAGSQTGHTLKIIDRIPIGVTVDTSSIQIQTDNGTPASTTGTIADCSASLSFPGCSPEPESDASRQCLTVVDGDITPQQTKAISFIATIDQTCSTCPPPPCDVNGVGAGLCNTALVQVAETGDNPSGTPRTSRILCPKPTTGDRLRTTGSGGCSLGTNADPTKSEIWPVMLLGALLWLRQRRRRSSARVKRETISWELVSSI